MQLTTYMKKFKNSIVPLILMIIFLSCDNEESDIQTEIKIPVSVISIKPQSISRFIETTGTVYSSKEATMKSELSGNYKLQVNPATRKPFALGDVVKSG
jgi:membrane fusion protein (multidrug efflux system)